MRITFLGTGTSVGVPMIGCACAVCASSDARNKRRRTSVYLQAGGTHVVVDTPPDFREQALAYRIPRVDAVLFTHSHADHIFGFDDIRRFNTIQNSSIPAYGSSAVLGDLRRVFSYIHVEKMPGLYRPQVEFVEIKGPFRLGPIEVRPFDVVHGADPVSGFRFEAEGRTLGYAPDCFEMPERAIEAVRGVDVMVLDALRHRPHKTHLTVADSVKLLQRIGAKRSYLIHLCHELDHAETEKGLPEGIRISYDGMALEW